MLSRVRCMCVFYTTSMSKHFCVFVCVKGSSSGCPRTQCCSLAILMTSLCSAMVCPPLAFRRLSGGRTWPKPTFLKGTGDYAVYFSMYLSSFPVGLCMCVSLNQWCSCGINIQVLEIQWGYEDNGPWLPKTDHRVEGCSRLPTRCLCG